MKSLKICVLICVAIVFSSCAMGYRNISKEDLNFPNKPQSDSINITVIQQPLQDSKNYGYDKLIKSKNFHLLALKITNNSQNDITIDNNSLKVFSHSLPDYPFQIQKMDTNKFATNSAKHLLWLPLNIYLFSVDVGFGDFFGDEPDSHFFILPVGAIIGPVNFARALYMNNKMKKDLDKLDIYGQTVPAGQSITGIISVITQNQDDLAIQIK